MTLAHILGEGSADEIVVSGLVLLGLVMFLRRLERLARQRHQEREDAAPSKTQ